MHNSYISNFIENSNFTLKTNIYVICWPNQTNHWLQPFDGIFFEPLKATGTRPVGIRFGFIQNKDLPSINLEKSSASLEKNKLQTPRMKCQTLKLVGYLPTTNSVYCIVAVANNKNQ